MKKQYLIIGATILIIGAATFFILNSKKEDTSEEQETNQNNTESVEDKIKENTYSIEFALENDKTLFIKKDDKAFSLNTAFSTSNSVIIQIDTKEIIEGSNTASYLEVVTTEQANKRAEDVTSTIGYNSLLEEYMATLSSTQCAILKPTDFQTKDINNYEVSYGEREDYCTFNLDTPETQAMHMYGFETEGYTVILSANGNVDNLPENPNELMERIIELFEIK